MKSIERQMDRLNHKITIKDKNTNNHRDQEAELMSHKLDTGLEIQWQAKDKITQALFHHLSAANLANLYQHLLVSSSSYLKLRRLKESDVYKYQTLRSFVSWELALALINCRLYTDLCDFSVNNHTQDVEHHDYSSHDHHFELAFLKQMIAYVDCAMIWCCSAVRRI